MTHTVLARFTKQEKAMSENPPTHNKTTIVLQLNCDDGVPDPECELWSLNWLFGKAGEERRMANVVRQQKSSPIAKERIRESSSNLTWHHPEILQKRRPSTVSQTLLGEFDLSFNLFLELLIHNWDIVLQKQT